MPREAVPSLVTPCMIYAQGLSTSRSPPAMSLQPEVDAPTSPAPQPPQRPSPILTSVEDTTDPISFGNGLFQSTELPFLMPTMSPDSPSMGPRSYPQEVLTTPDLIQISPGRVPKHTPPPLIDSLAIPDLTLLFPRSPVWSNGSCSWLGRGIRGTIGGCR